MVANPEMVVVDPDAPTDASAKRAIMSVPTWLEFLKQNGFEIYLHAENEEDCYWKRQWRDQGRGWEVVVLPSSDTIYVRVLNNPERNYHRIIAEVQTSERKLATVVKTIITEIERGVSDATKRRRIKAYAKATPSLTRIDYKGPNMQTEAGPIKRPVPDDPNELNKQQMDQLLDRIQTRCFLKGQRVKVLRPNHSRLAGKTGTVVDAGVNSCYVELDDYANAGDSDPFRFMADELQSINESTEDLDAPEPYLAAMDYIVPLKQAGYVPAVVRMGTSHIKTYKKEITGPKGSLKIKVFPVPDEPTAANIYVDYYQNGEDDHLLDMIVDAIDVPDRVRELEELFLDSPSAVVYVDKLRAQNYPRSSVFKQRDFLIYLFGESIVEAADPDDPTPYLAELTRHAELINVFRAHGVRLGRRLSPTHPYYRMFYIPSAVTDVSYDIYLEPQGDQSWKVTAEGSKEFQDQRGEDFVHEFEIDSQWNIPAGTPVETLNGIVDDLLSELRSHTGPDEAPISEPDVDDIDEGIDDPDVTTLTQERTDFFKQEGYVYKADYKGNPHWEKKWPLPLPIKTGKTVLTDLMIHPGHGQIWYSLVDAAGRPKGGWSIRLPGGDTPYTTSLRRALLKMRHVAERMPVDANFNDMFSFLRNAFDKVQDEVERESRLVSESEVDDNIDFAQYAKDSASYTPTQLLTPKALRQIGRDAGYTVHSCYHSNRTRGFSLKMYPASQEVLQQFLQFSDKEAYRVLEAYRQGIMTLLPELGKIEQGAYKLDDKIEIHCFPWGGLAGALPADPKYHVLFVSIQPRDHEYRGVGGILRVPESLDDPDDAEAMVKRTRTAKMGDLVKVICPNCGDTHEAFKNWPDGAPPEWGFPCAKCGAHIPLTHVVVESVDDPDSVDATKYTDDTLNVPKLLTELGYRHDELSPWPHWAKYVTPKLLFTVFYEEGTTWQFQVYRPLDQSGRWTLKTAAPGREISTLKTDLEKWEREARAGTVLTGVNESVDEPNIDSFTRTTYDPAAFLAEQGWVLISDKKYHTKTIPVPVEYHMGNMVFTGIQFRIGTELSLFKSTWVSATFVGRDGTGFGIAGKDLMPQLMFAPQEGGDVPPDDHYDINMPIRRFATGIVDEMNKLAWPESKHAAPLANSKVKVAFDGLVNRLNEMAKEPLHPAIEESAEDDVDPASMLNQLPQQTYVLFVRRHDEDDEIAQANYPDLPLEQALPQQLLRELAESKVFDMKTVSVSGYSQPENQNIYHVRLLFTGQDSDVNLRDRLYDAIREAAVAGEFVIEQFRPESKPKAAKQSRCRHCERYIQQENGVWVDPEATGDDSVWRETCDANETFTADHEPMDYFSEALDPDDPETVLRSQPGFHFQSTQFMGEKVYVKGDPESEDGFWPLEIGNVLLGPGPNPPYNRQRWYVIHVRGIPQYDLCDYGLGVAKVKGHPPLKTFDTKEDAALAIWLLRQQMPIVDNGYGGKKKQIPRK